VVTIDAPGGGGYGDPFERELEMVETDVAEGYVTIEKAREEYGGVIDPVTMKANEGATGKLRNRSKKRSSRQ
jgi:N-methylhydantoinase B